MHFWDRHKTITGYYESLTSSICDKYDLTQMEYAIVDCSWLLAEPVLTQWRLESRHAFHPDGGRALA